MSDLDTLESYNNMTIAELKELLKAANLNTSGKKPTLIKRLSEANWLKILENYETYESMTIAELKEFLKHRGETTFGSKKDLITRLTGYTKKQIFQGLGKNAPSALPMSLLPSINYHLRDYGINANDPAQTLYGLRVLNHHSLQKMFQQLLESIHTPYIDVSVRLPSEYSGGAMELMIMSVVYTGDWFAFRDLSELNTFLQLESRPCFIMNWVSKEFVELIRQQGPTGPFPFTLFNDFE